MVTLDDVRRARERIATFLHRTPVLTSVTIDAEIGARVFWKCENLQKVGAFKARGALNAVLSLGDDEARRGVVTHSSGNHAAALAWAARARGISCTVVMPQTASPIKMAAVRGYGARIELCAEGERESACARVQRETGAVLIPPFDDARVIAGQATAAAELLEEVPDLDVIVAPVGGGGLLAGTAVAASGAKKRVRVFGAEPEAVDDAHRSLSTGQRQPAVAGAKTVADGLRTGLGELNFALLRAHGVQVLTVSESAIVTAARDFLERMKIVVEPSGATPLAALRKQRDAWRGLAVGAILSGGNTDFAWLSR